jgi:hypothetical protein
MRAIAKTAMTMPAIAPPEMPDGFAALLEGDEDIEGDEDPVDLALPVEVDTEVVEDVGDVEDVVGAA